MVQIIPRSPTLGDVLGKGLGEGFSQGVTTGLADKLKQFNEQKRLNAERAKNLESLPQKLEGSLKFLYGKEGAEGFKEDTRGRALDLAKQLYEQTGNYAGSIEVAARSIPQVEEQMIAEERAKQPKKEEGTGLLTYLQGLVPLPILSAAKEGMKAAPRKGEILGTAKEAKEEFGRGFNEESVAGKLLGRVPSRKSGESPKTYAGRIAGQIGKLSADAPFMMIGGALTPMSPATGALAVPELIGSVADEVYKGLRDEDKYTLAKGGEAANRVLNKVAKSAIMGMTLSKASPLLKTALEKNPITKKIFDDYVGEKLLDVATTTGALGTVGPVLEGEKPRFGDYLDALGITLAFEAANIPSSLKRSFEEKASKSGMKPQQFAEEVKREYTKQGGNSEDLQEGKGPEYQKLNKAINEVAKKALEEKLPSPAKGIEETPEKIKLEEYESRRKAEAKSLKEKPLEYLLERSEPSKAIQELYNTESKLTKSVAEYSDQVRKIKRIQEEGIATAQGRKNAEFALKANEKNLAEAEKNLSEIKNAIKEKKPTISERDLDAQIRRHTDKLIDIAKKPGSETDVKLHKDFLRDQKYAQKANEILSAGKELPEPVTRDTYLKMNEAYNKAYRSMLNELKDLQARKDLTPEQIDHLSNLSDRLNKNLDVSDNKLKLHKMKRSARERVKSPFMRKYLKDLGSSMKQFEKDFFKYKQAVSEIEKVTEKVGKAKISERQINERLREYEKNPIKAAREKLAEDAGIPKAEANKLHESAKAEGQKLGEEMKKGDITESKLKSFIEKALVDFKTKQLPKAKKAVIGAVILGGLQEGIEKVTGFKVPISYLALFTPGTMGIRFGAAGIASLGKRILIKISDSNYSNKYKEANTHAKRQALLKEMRSKGLSATRINKIKKAA